MYARHVTLTASTVNTITMPSDFGNVEVVNVDGASAVYFTVDGTTPTVAGNDTFVLPAAIGGVETQPESGAATVVKLISAGTPKVSVRGW